MYLVITTIGLILGLELMGIRCNFPLEYNIYIIDMVMEMLVDIKNKLTPYLINIGYNLLYGFSFCQIQINKIVKLITPYVKDVKQYLKDKGLIEEIKMQSIEIISKNGDVEHRLLISDKTPLETFVDMFELDKHMGVLLYDKDFETGCINNIYREKLHDIRDYKLSNINFMMIELEHENEKHPIVLKNNTYNYYIVNNSLNQNFFKYYLKNVLNVPINEYNFNYNVTIIDHNVNMLTLLPHQHIVFNENDYTIHHINNIESTPTTFTTPTIPTTPTDTIIDEQSSNSDSDKSDDFVKLDAET